MNMEFNMLHLSMINMIISDLKITLIIIVDNSIGLNKKSKIIEKMTNANSLSSYIEIIVILGLYSLKRDYLLYLT